MKKLLLCGLFVLLMVFVIPVDALYFAHDDAFDIVNAPMGWHQGINMINVCKNDFPYPVPSDGTVVITENPQYGSAFVYVDHEIIVYNSQLSDRPYYGPDHFKYKFCEGQSCSNEATVYLNVISYLEHCPSHIWLSTSSDSMLVINVNNVLECYPFITGIDAMRVISGPRHGMLTPNDTGTWPYNCDMDFCFDYKPNAGFRGWDSFVLLPGADPGHMTGFLPGKPVVVDIYVGPDHPVPEFPSLFLPVTMIIGFLGTVFYIRRSRDN